MYNLTFLLFIIYLYQQINNLETLFNATCLDLSIIVVFNLKIAAFQKWVVS